MSHKISIAHSNSVFILYNIENITYIHLTGNGTFIIKPVPEAIQSPSLQQYKLH